MSLMGVNFWPFHIVNDMKKEIYNNMEIEMFGDAPDNLYMSLVNTVKLFPDKQALVEDNQIITYKEFKELVDVFASNLFTMYSVKKGDRVALLLVNSIDFCVAFYAIAKLGAISVPLSTKAKSTELSYFLKDSGAKVLILNEQWWENIKDIISFTKIKHFIITGDNKNNINAKKIELLYNKKGSFDKNVRLPQIHDPVAIMYTSGTTGVPKGALLSHFNILHGVISYKRIFDLSSEDSTVIAIPIFHITGLAALLCLFVHVGGTIYLQPYFNAKKVLKTVQEKKITFLHGSPTVFILLLEQSQNFAALESLKKAACGSANMPPEVLFKIKRWLPKTAFHTVYGLTETSSPATIFPTDVYGSNKMGSSGVPIPGVEIKIIDEEGMECPCNSVGELLIRGSVVLEKYWNSNQKATEDGWFKTGDLAKFDNDGYIYIVDRKKDMINRGGEKIYSFEVENILYTHPAVKEVAVIGVPDPVYGEVVKAVIVTNEGYSLTEEEVKEWVKQKLAKYKVPAYVQFINEMPRTNNGKISKKIIKQYYNDTFQKSCNY
ncbi:MAG: long-chain acyl-CoA synthetase [Clostridiales bacterium]|jgi:long-chain acyl-CoA synthetase|nr:long-chain acyl-CoA synthetase [Clostridiales bacterium]MDK2932255.1 long-chain acyl-CoA synthetase [Clostridiales bacterium]